MGQKFRDRQAKAELSKKGANSMAVTGLNCRNDLVGTVGAISVLFGILGVRNMHSHLVWPPFPAFKAGVWQIGIS